MLRIDVVDGHYTFLGKLLNTKEKYAGLLRAGTVCVNPDDMKGRHIRDVDAHWTEVLSETLTQSSSWN